MAAGWHRDVMVDGTARNIYEQEASWNCGMACVAMVINRKSRSFPSTRAVAAISRENVGGEYVPATVDRAGFRAPSPIDAGLVRAMLQRRAMINPEDNPLMNLARDMRRQQGGAVTYGALAGRLQEGADPGTGGLNLAATLRGYGVNATHHSLGNADAGRLRAAMRNASLANPLILGLVNPPHFVVCDGRATQPHRYVFCDPADGAGYVGRRVGRSVRFSTYDTAVDEMIVA